MKQKYVLIIAAIVGAGALLRGAEPLTPIAVEIKQAMERGKVVRNQTALVPEALSKSAVVLKAGEVRSGHIVIQLEDAKGEGGATYRMIENLKICSPSGLDMEVIEYTGVLLLGPDLSLMSGKQVTSRTIHADKATEKEVNSAQILVAGDELSWTRTEKLNNGDENVSKSEPTKLYGVKPIPRNALFALAAMAKKDPGFKMGMAGAICVPALDLGMTIETFLVQPAWITFEEVNEKKVADAALNMTVRYLIGVIEETGLIVDEPTESVWHDPMIWSLNEKMKVVAHPDTGDRVVSATTVDPARVNVEARLDLAKIRETVKAIEEKNRQEDFKKSRGRQVERIQE